MNSPFPILISCDEDSQPFAEAELKEMFPQMPPPSWVEGNPEQLSGVARVEPPVDFSTFSATVNRAKSVFIRHYSPVQVEVPLSNKEADLSDLWEATNRLLPLIDPTKTLSVQTRLLGDDFRPFSRTQLNSALFTVIVAATGVTLEARHPEQVLSVLCAPERAYLGVSLAAQNRSLWPGGHMRFKREEGQISRAEFKLMEAISVFDLQIPDKGTALDIGAAPGGWTNVLRRFGLRVIAVDPADLHESLRRDRQVVHIPERIQNYRPTEMFDIMVNDLKMDARDSVEIMLCLLYTSDAADE